MARKPNYDFEKRKKELDRKAKQDAKQEEKARRKREQAEQGGQAEDQTALPGTEAMSEIAGLPVEPRSQP